MAKIKKITLLTVVLLCFVLALIFSLPSKTAYAYSSDNANLLFIINFKDSTEISSETVSALEDAYNINENGVKAYFSAVSRGKINLQTYTMKNSENSYVFTLPHNQNYYEPMYAYKDNQYIIVNDGGYDNRYYSGANPVLPTTSGAKQHVDGYYREQELIRYVVESVGEVSNSINFDCNGDKEVDSLTIMLNSLNVTADEWGDLLWPHMSALCDNRMSISLEYYVPRDYSLDYITKPYPKINEISVFSYSLYSLGKLRNGNSINTGTLCHELMHNFGAMDYYSYLDQSYDYLGEFDIMATDPVIPPYPTTYVRQKMGWVTEKNIPSITETNTYTLYPTTMEKDYLAYKIDLDDESEEYFMIEARSNKTGVFDSTLSDSGLIIYRISEKEGRKTASGDYGNAYYGNMYGENAYIFRIGGGSKLTKGVYTTISPSSQVVSLATLNGQTISYTDSYLDLMNVKTLNKTSYGSNLATTGDIISYTDGRNSEIIISEVVENEDGSYTFKVTIPNSGVGGEITPEVEEPIFNFKDKKLDIYFRALAFGNKVKIIVTSTKLTKAQFDGRDTNNIINFKLPYSYYNINFDLSAYSDKVYICMMFTKGDTYSSYYVKEIILNEEIIGEEISNERIVIEGFPKYDKGTVSWNNNGEDGYLVICKAENFTGKTAEELYDACSEYEYVEFGSGSVTTNYDKKDLYIFAVTEKGVSYVYRLDENSERKSEGCKMFSNVSIVAVVPILCCLVIRKKKN